jgi:hypothetical protein
MSWFEKPRPISVARFGGINVITDGYTFNVFSLTVQNLQLANNYSCNYDYRGAVRMVGNTFGYLRARNIYITNGQVTGYPMISGGQCCNSLTN